MIFDGYVIHPDHYLQPNIKLTPFGNNDLGTNRGLQSKGATQKFFHENYSDYQNYITESGRQALDIALLNLDLKKTDVVSILTTTNNLYISSCVTATIEKHCLWNRAIDKSTKVIFVNHEFGYCLANLAELRKYDLPIIEDCAYSFNSNNDLNNTGRIGDYVLFSFPKFFPIQTGGMLLSRKALKTYEKDADTCNYVDGVIGKYLYQVSNFSQTRVDNYYKFISSMKPLGIEERITMANNTVPGVFLFKLPEAINAVDLKKFYYANGVECSVFYGENAFFLPCHHKIDSDQIEYIYKLLEYFVTSKKH